MSYMALYRKFRPDTFEDVKGQEHIVTTLKNQIKGNRLGHAYLFTGTRGTGKTTVAKILAKTVNCENPVDGSPCGQCASCKAIAQGTSMNVIEMDAASNNGVDNVRQIVEEIAYAPVSGKYKVYIIDEVHMLSGNAFNALLKTLEEPPQYVIFILATTEVHKIPITILSRCQRYDFRRITVDTITARLSELMVQEGIEAEEKALRYVAKVGDGSMRDSLSLLDRCIAFYYGKKLTYESVLEVLGAVDTTVFSNLIHLINQSDIKGSMEKLEEIVMEGRELSQFVSDFLTFLRNLLLICLSDKAEEMIDLSADNIQVMKDIAGQMDINQINRYIRVLAETSEKMRFASQKRILLETAIVKLCTPAMERTYDSLVDEIRVLRNQIESGKIAVINKEQASPEVINKPSMSREEYEKLIPGDIQRLNDMWDRVVIKTKEVSIPVADMIKKAKRHVEKETGKLTITVGPSVSYMMLDKETASGEKNLSQLKEIIEETAGGKIDFEIITLEADQKVNDTGKLDITNIPQMLGSIDTEFDQAMDFEDD